MRQIFKVVYTISIKLFLSQILYRPCSASLTVLSLKLFKFMSKQTHRILYIILDYYCARLRCSYFWLMTDTYKKLNNHKSKIKKQLAAATVAAVLVVLVAVVGLTSAQICSHYVLLLLFTLVYYYGLFALSNIYWLLVADHVVLVCLFRQPSSCEPRLLLEGQQLRLLLLLLLPANSVVWRRGQWPM